MTHQFLSDISASATKTIGGILNGFWGPQFDQRAFGPVTLGELATAVVILIFTAIVHGIISLILNRKSKTASAQEKVAKHHVLLASGKPIYLLIWTFGFYVAVLPLLLKWPAAGAVVQDLMGRLFDVGFFFSVLWFCMRLTHVLESRLAAWAAKTNTKFDDLLVPLVGKSLRVLVPVLGIIFALPILNLPAEYSDVVAKGTSILLIGAVAWILFEAVNVGQNVLLLSHDLKAADNLQARKMYTQVKVLGKAVHVAVALCTLATILMLFQQVRHVGASLLASAGIVGIIAGIAGQQTLANLFAGFQIALAQPIRLDDVVVVEGAWGRIEEITLTYVVVHVWDDTRLVLPLSYFIQKPFQNWTRASAHITGQVHVFMDYSLPVEEIRKALKPIVENNPLWDKRFWNLQVVEATEKSMQLRVLLTAVDSSKAWDLRCKVREELIAFIQQHHPECLPRFRAETNLRQTAGELAGGREVPGRVKARRDGEQS